MTGMDDPTIICSYLMVELSVLAGRKIILRVHLPHPPWWTRVNKIICTGQNIVLNLLFPPVSCHIAAKWK